MNLQRGLLSISLAIVSVAGYCQNPGLAWVGVLNGDNTKSSSQVAVDNSGNVYTVGGFFGNFDADPLAGEELLTALDVEDGYIIKQNSAGTFQWVVQLSGDGMQHVQAVSISADGSIVAGGYFDGTVDFDPGAGVEEHTSPGGQTPFLMKLTPAGALVWVKVFFAVDGTGAIASIDIDQSNNIFIGGQMLGTFDSDPSSAVFNLVSEGNWDLWFAKFEGDGDFVNAASTGGSGEDIVQSIIIDNNSELVAAGQFSADADLDPGTGTATFTSNGAVDPFILKLDNALTYLWGGQISGNNDVTFGGIDHDASNNIIFNGTLAGTADFDPGSGTFNMTSAFNDMFIAKWKNDGSFDWAKNAGSINYTAGEALAVDGSGNIFVAGKYSGDFDINPDPTIVEIIPFEADGYDMYFAKFNNSGSLLWYHPIPSGDFVTPAHMTIDSNDNIYITGDWNEDVDFTSNTCVNGSLVTTDNALLYTVKYNATSNPACFGFLEQPQPTAVGCNMQTIQLSAPAGGTTHITYQWQMFTGTVWIDLSDQEFEEEPAVNGYEGTNSPYLKITAIEGAEYGNIRCMVNGDGVTTIYSNTVNFTISATPAIPGVVATSGCGPGNYAVEAIGPAGEYTWYIDGELVDDEHGSKLSHYFFTKAIVGVAVTDAGGCSSDKSLVAINTNACKQPPGLSWIQRIGPGLIQPVDIAFDSQNEIVIAGQFYAQADFDPGSGVFNMTPTGPNNDYFVAKYKADGSFIFALQTDMRIMDIAIGPGDNIYYGGNFTGTIDIDPGSGVFTMAAPGIGADMSIVKLASDGSFIWAKQLVGTLNENGNFIRGMAISSSDEVIVTGSFTKTVDFDPSGVTASQTSASTFGPDIFTAKYDNNGNYLWAVRTGSTAQVERGHDVAVDSDGNIYVVGLFQTTVDFNPGAGAANIFNLTSAGQTDAFLQALDGGGNFRWAVRIGGPTADEAVTIDLDDSDHPVIAGTFSGNIDFDPDATGTFMMSGGPGFILKLTDLGAFEYAKQVDGAILKIFVDDTDKVTFTGVFNDNIDLDPGPDDYILYTAIDADIFVAQLDFDGSFLWGYNTNSSGLEYFTNEASGVIMDNNGDVYITGWFNNVIDVDPTNCTMPLQAVSGTRETFIQKIKVNTATLCFSLQPKDVAGCDANDIHLLAEAVGTTNITYQWYYFDVGDNSFLAIDVADPGFSGVQTNELVISATPTFGAGRYRVRVFGDNVSDQTSDIAEVTVGVTPAAPTFNPVSFCSPGAKDLEVGGGTDGNYRWYEDPAADPIAGAINHVFTTPFLDGTTTYYATIVNGNCPSDFTTVEATINITLDAPTVTGAVSCSPASLTLKASGATSGSYYWYANFDDDVPVATNAGGDFVTPTLTTTTTYYVAVNDGTCESLRTEVVAEIGNLAMPSIIPATICTNASTTLTATGATGEIRWYSAASGGSPIHTGTTFTTPALSATTTYHVSAFDGTCETSRKPVIVTVNVCTSNQPPVITSTSPSVAAGGTLSVNLNPLISDPDNNIDPASLKIVVQPKSGATASIDQNGQLVIDYAGRTFSGEDEVTIEVCDVTGSCFQRVIKIQVVGEMFVYNAVSPNGDGKNDVLFLAFVDATDETRENRVTIYNRWGDLVFDVDDYDNSTNVFAGRSNGGKDLPSGTYYYKIEFQNGRKSQSGYLSLKR